MKVLAACDTMLALDEARNQVRFIFVALFLLHLLSAYQILSYIESRMSIIAPNVSAIVGPAVAAKLLSLAGGLSNLAKIPACNLQALGANKKRSSLGLAVSATSIHRGVLFSCDMVVNAPPDLRIKAVRLVASKLVLAARVDSLNATEAVSPAAVAASASNLSEIGIRLRDEIQKKLDKLMEPPPVKQVKPLPLPIDKPRKKRGGRRLRKNKEKMEQTDLRKQMNRMVCSWHALSHAFALFLFIFLFLYACVGCFVFAKAFGKAEEEILDSEGVGLGMIGQNLGTGKLKIVAKDTQKLAKCKPVCSCLACLPGAVFFVAAVLSLIFIFAVHSISCFSQWPLESSCELKLV